MPPLDIRPMRRSDLDTALAWADAEGWNPGLADADPFWAADPTGYLMGWLADEPVGCISAVSYGHAFGFLGLYICRPEQRGKGYGIQLWRQALNMLGDRTIGLDGVVAQQANYARQGFVFAHRNIRYGGKAGGGAMDERVRPVTPALLDAVAALDRTCFPAARPGFLGHWLTGPRTALAFVEDGEVHGYGVVRASTAGFKIGPLFAETAEAAKALFSALARQANGSEIVVDVSEQNGAARELVDEFGLSPVFETARMYRGRPPELPQHRIYGITTLELG